MEYLLFLKKFDLSLAVLQKKLEQVCSDVVLKPEQKGYLLTTSSIDVAALLSLPEVETLYLLVTSWKPFSFFSLRQDCLIALQEHGKKSYVIKTKFYDKIPISALSLYKHINPYVKHEGFIPTEDNFETTLFVEMKKDGKDVFCRVGISAGQKEKHSSAVAYPFVVAIEEPRTLDELTDLIRVCWIFQLPLYIITKEIDEKQKLFLKAKEIVKGIDLEKFSYFVQEKLPVGFTVVGFSRHAATNEYRLKSVFSAEKKVCFLFGNETYGLSQTLRDKTDLLVKLGPASKKPFTASQALSYVLGIYTAEKL